MTYKIDENAVNASISMVDETLKELETVNGRANVCLGLANSFFALANAVPGVSGRTSVNFDSAFNNYNTAIKAVGNLINDLLSDSMSVASTLGRALGDIPFENMNLEYGYATVGGEKIHLNSNYINKDSMIAGFAVKDSDGKVVSSLVFSRIYVDSETKEKMYEITKDGETFSIGESLIDEWIKKEYYNTDGSVKDGYGLSILVGNKSNEKDDSYNLTPMAWVDSDALKLKKETHNFYEANANLAENAMGIGMGVAGTIGKIKDELTKFNSDKLEPVPQPVPDDKDPDRTNEKKDSVGGSNQLSADDIGNVSSLLEQMYGEDKTKTYDYSVPWCAIYANNKVKELAENYGIDVPSGNPSTYETMKQYMNDKNAQLYVKDVSTVESGNIQFKNVLSEEDFKNSKTVSYIPKPGDLIFMDVAENGYSGNDVQWDPNLPKDGPGGNKQTHTAIVKSYNPETGEIITLEGNISTEGGNGIFSRTNNYPVDTSEPLTINSPTIIGFGSWYNN